MLYNTLKRLIERGQTAGLENKIDIFYAAGKLTDEQYTELLKQLAQAYYDALDAKDKAGAEEITQ
nr:MAG TPA: Short C-terminal domain [Caudoviricetes sp.]